MSGTLLNPYSRTGWGWLADYCKNGLKTMTDENNEDSGKVSLSRRKALAGIGTIGVAGAIGGFGTIAQFTDTEERTVEFTAGGVDGTIEIGASYNGNDVVSQKQGSSFGEVENVNGGGAGVAVNFTDVKPGDYGCFSFNLIVENNPAWAAACINYDNSNDGIIYDPERDPDPQLNESDFDSQDDGSGTEGEMEENMLVIPFYKPPVGQGTPDRFDPCIFFDSQSDSFDASAYEGSGAVGTSTQFWSNSEGGGQETLYPQTLEDAVSESEASTVTWGDSSQSNFTVQDYSDSVITGPGCVFLNGDSDDQLDNTQEPSALSPGEEYGFGWDWHLPFDTGNEVQGDEITVQFGFTFAQERHTQSPELSNVFEAGANTPN